ncbi:TPA: hypothetical protein DDY55_00750 [Candidatus Falkowbacteria bacterium]|nr:hypothetical protein [Candidatus Falkowbacteria bacterium]HAY12817.1 hypothetical protein [Candidatus Falkowbacteria bacterium]HBI96636.1 hypothetical protein [Candidatus Falkowbacteria bacterium]HBT27245.1 hypothetical protein [Candidatus Falkowbacteria bacterium]HBY15045.1 hypothetical protein [Candidatus Falkowbacteria bacterium]
MSYKNEPSQINNPETTKKTAKFENELGNDLEKNQQTADRNAKMQMPYADLMKYEYKRSEEIKQKINKILTKEELDILRRHSDHITGDSKYNYPPTYEQYLKQREEESTSFEYDLD